MDILFLIYHGFSDVSGISKKIHYQINGLRSLGHKVYVCYYDYDKNGKKARFIDNNVIQDFGHGRMAGIKARCEYNAIVEFAIKNKIDFIYSRSFHNANPFTIHLFHEFRRHGMKSVIEIPTYPYDMEYVGFPFLTRLNLKIDKIFRKGLAINTDAIVTFSNDKEIFGQKTINISNGIELESIPLKQNRNDTTKEMHFIGVAEVHYWHGFDRFIHGMGEYYKNGGEKRIYFHIVGGVAPCEMHDSEHAPGFQELMVKYGIEDKVILYGQMYGKELDDIFEQCDFAIGSLARHRSGVYNIKTLKNREYAARGIPFIYSETDDDFDTKPYIIKAPADERAIDVEKVINFNTSLKVSPKEIRGTVNDLSWKNQMNKVIKREYGGEI